MAIVLSTCLASGLVAAAAPTPAADEGTLRVVGVFMSALEGGRYAETDIMLTQPMKDGIRQMGVAGIGEFWKLLQSQVGKLARVNDPYVRETTSAYTSTVVPCEFEAGLFDLQVSVSAAGLVAGLQVLPHADRALIGPRYIDVASYTEVPVGIGDPKAPLNGVLSLPIYTSAFPLVVMLSGSGPNDMDETIGPNKPFRDISGGLATAGIASIRFDKRTRSYPEAAPTHSMLNYEYFDDALAAIRLAATVPGVTKVVLLGHSEGAALAPSIAANGGSGVAGIVCLAGPVTSMGDLIAYQYGYLSSLGRIDKPTVEAVRKAIGDMNRGALPADALVVGAPVEYYRDLAALGNPAEVASSLALPLFLAFGARDYQVPPAEEALWMKQLAGKSWVSSKVYSGLNHLMMAGEGTPTPDEYATPGHVNADLIKDLSEWLARL